MLRFFFSGFAAEGELCLLRRRTFCPKELPVVTNWPWSVIESLTFSCPSTHPIVLCPDLTYPRVACFGAMMPGILVENKHNEHKEQQFTGRDINLEVFCRKRGAIASPRVDLTLSSMTRPLGNLSR